MPLFVCNDCGTVDDSDLAVWPDGAGGAPQPPRCYDCWEPGRWHGRFPRRHWRDYALEYPAQARQLLNLRPCFCGADPLSHDYANPQMPHKGTGCAGYSPVPWRPEHSRAR